MQVLEEKRVLDSRARAVPISSLSWSCVNLITMASSGNGVVFANVLSPAGGRAGRAWAGCHRERLGVAP